MPPKSVYEKRRRFNFEVKSIFFSDARIETKGNNELNNEHGFFLDEEVNKLDDRTLLEKLVDREDRRALVMNNFTEGNSTDGSDTLDRIMGETLCTDSNDEYGNTDNVIFQLDGDGCHPFEQHPELDLIASENAPDMLDGRPDDHQKSNEQVFPRVVPCQPSIDDLMEVDELSELITFDPEANANNSGDRSGPGPVDNRSAHTSSSNNNNDNNRINSPNGGVTDPCGVPVIQTEEKILWERSSVLSPHQVPIIQTERVVKSMRKKTSPKTKDAFVNFSRFQETPEELERVRKLDRDRAATFRKKQKIEKEALMKRKNYTVEEKKNWKIGNDKFEKHIKFSMEKLHSSSICNNEIEDLKERFNSDKRKIQYEFNEKKKEPMHIELKADRDRNSKYYEEFDEKVAPTLKKANTRNNARHRAKYASEMSELKLDIAELELNIDQEKTINELLHGTKKAIDEFFLFYYEKMCLIEQNEWKKRNIVEKLRLPIGR